MKNRYFHITLASALMMLVTFTATAQTQYSRPLDNTGLTVFESDKSDQTPFEGLAVYWGAAFTQQFQALSHENAGNMDLLELGNGFNLATANLITMCEAMVTMYTATGDAEREQSCSCSFCPKGFGGFPFRVECEESSQPDEESILGAGCSSLDCNGECNGSLCQEGSTCDGPPKPTVCMVFLMRVVCHPRMLNLSAMKPAILKNRKAAI